MHRRLRQHHGEDELPERADQLHHRAQPQRPEDPPGPAALIGYAIALVLMISALITAVVTVRWSASTSARTACSTARTNSAASRTCTA
ncbi:hypothetical protein ACPA9J_07005 [Pseudomonas aeruginosa]